MFARTWLMLIGAMFALTATGAHAQTTYTNTDTANNNIDGTRTCPSAPLVRNFTVGTNFVVSDVDLGLIAAHSWRGDMRITLQSPTGTRVQIVNGDTSSAANADNYNVRFDDSAATLVNANNSNHNTGATPYQFNRRPNNLLSAFNGENSRGTAGTNGTWRLEICDLFPGSDNGTFLRADLFLMGPMADLSLTKTVSNASPASGTSVSYTLSVSSAAASTATATGVQVRDILPAGFNFTGASGTGTYNNATGIWTVGSVPVGATRSITINGTVNATSGAVVTNTAEIIASSLPDPDSTPANGATGEDDYASRSFTVSGNRVAGVPPVLSCPVGNTVFDWDTRTWPAGSLNNSYTQTGLGSLNFTITTNTPFVNNTPVVNNNQTGGLVPAQNGLFQNMNNNAQADQSTLVLTLPVAVPGVQFRVFDVDFLDGQFADRMTFTGSFNGAPVMPVVTNGVANYVVGNTVIGDAASGNTEADGNAVVTFTSPVDRITITYGNHTTAPTNPGNQFASIHDFNFCNPQANLSVTKVSTVVSDPVNGTNNPKAIPGAIVSYCILISNAGSATTTAVTATDNIPANLTFTPGSMRSGTSCAGASTVEDDNASGADESDPYGARISGAVLTMTANSLSAGNSFALTFQATVN